MVFIYIALLPYISIKNDRKMKEIVHNKYLCLAFLPRVVARLNRQIITDDQF